MIDTRKGVDVTLKSNEMHTKTIMHKNTKTSKPKASKWFRLGATTALAVSLSAVQASSLVDPISTTAFAPDPIAQVETQISSVMRQEDRLLSGVREILPSVVAAPVVGGETALQQFASLSFKDIQSVPLDGDLIAPEIPDSISEKTLANMAMPTGGEEFRCLSEALYFEARGETLAGQLAVAEVIMNRVGSKKYPNSICGVVYQGVRAGSRACQFSYACDGHPEVFNEKKAFARVSKIARLIVDGYRSTTTNGALFYHTTGVSPSWARKFQRTAKIGVHIFYRN